jgi:hypothetical protein
MGTMDTAEGTLARHNHVVGKNAAKIFDSSFYESNQSVDVIINNWRIIVTNVYVISYIELARTESTSQH